MQAQFSFYRKDGFTWVVVNGRTYKTKNLDEAFDLLEKMANEMGQVVQDENKENTLNSARHAGDQLR
jgi:hypothetical protein